MNNTTKRFVILLLALVFSVQHHNVLACSGYKITYGGKTMFGSNEDAWRTTPQLWFEIAHVNSPYGAAFTGSRYDGSNGFAPQAGMNDQGLVFERLVAYHPPLENHPIHQRKKITNQTLFLKQVLHSCKNVYEVYNLFSTYDHSMFSDDVFIYADANGDYLIVEPYSLSIGNDSTYVLANFCPSLANNASAKQQRYINGKAFLSSKTDSSLAFCKRLSDTMHVCRPYLGDGTLLTTIWNLTDKTVNLYFYHNYTTTRKFNVITELKKGNHAFAVKDLFPPNAEFDALANYSIPKNNTTMAALVVGSGVFFLFSFLYFLYQYLFKRKNGKMLLHATLTVWSFIMVYEMLVLSGPINRFYFAAPYIDALSTLQTLASFVPFLVALVVLPLFIFTLRTVNNKQWNVLSKTILVVNTVLSCIFIGLFYYWHFYSVF